MDRIVTKGCKQTMFVGDRYLVKQGWCEVVKYINKSNVTVRFDNTGSEVTGTTFQIRSGSISDYLVPSVCGVGFLGKDNIQRDGYKEIHSLWSGILERCYCNKFKKNHPSYNQCVVEERWKNFSIFYDDVCRMKRLEKWEIDKDLLMYGNRVYGKEFCVFLPKEINIQIKMLKPRDLPTGVFKSGNKFIALCSSNNMQQYLGTFDDIKEAENCYLEFKSKKLATLAEKYKDSLDNRAYNALINYGKGDI